MSRFHLPSGLVEQQRIFLDMTQRLALLGASLFSLGAPPLAGAQSPAAKGEVAAITIASAAYPAGRHGWVYTPPGYPASCRSACNFLLAFDGSMYLGAMPLPGVLDSLIASHRAPPTVAVLFDNGAPPGRIEDLANSARFAAFVVNDLVPWVRAHYAVTRAPEHTVIAGSRAGGFGAAYVALKYPDVFGNVLSQGGAFWRGNEASNDPPYEWTAQHVVLAPRANVRFFLDVGSMETVGAMGGAAPSLLDANRRLRDALKAKGYAVEYFEVPGGQHSPETWRTRLPAGIVALMAAPK